MKRLSNLCYTIGAKIFLVLIIWFLSWQTSVCFAETTVLYLENDTALRNVWYQWENFDYRSSVYLQDEVEEAIDMVLEYCLYYHRDITDKNQTIISADEDYKRITDRLSSYKDFSFAVVNHTTGRIVSDIEEINYKKSGTAVRQFFSGREDCMLIIRNSHNPYYENGTTTEYNEYAINATMTYSDNFDLYIYFGEDFSFAAELEDYQAIHQRFLERVKTVTVMAAVYLLLVSAVFALLLIIAGKNEPSGKIYPGLSDRLPNDAKLLLFTIVIISMTALYENSLYMAQRADEYDIWPVFSSEFYIFRSYVAMIVNVSIIVCLGCTFKRQYKLGRLFTNTYIYKFFFEKHD